MENIVPSSAAIRLADKIDLVVRTATPIRIELIPADLKALRQAGFWELRVRGDGTLTFMSLPVGEAAKQSALVVAWRGVNKRTSLKHVFGNRD